MLLLKRNSYYIQLDIKILEVFVYNRSFPIVLAVFKFSKYNRGLLNSRCDFNNIIKFILLL